MWRGCSLGFGWGDALQSIFSSIGEFFSVKWDDLYEALWESGTGTFSSGEPAEDT